MVVYGLPESSAESNIQRIEDDRQILTDIIEKIINSGDSVSIERTIRLGKHIDLTNPRPIKLYVKTEVQKDVLLSNAFKLKKASPGIYFHRLHTRRERVLFQKRKEELAEIDADERVKYTIRNFQIVPRIRPRLKPILITKQ